MHEKERAGHLFRQIVHKELDPAAGVGPTNPCSYTELGASARDSANREASAGCPTMNDLDLPQRILRGDAYVESTDGCGMKTRCGQGHRSCRCSKFRRDVGHDIAHEHIRCRDRAR